MECAIQLILEIVGKRFDVSRAYIFENSSDGKYCDNTYEWCNEGIAPEKDNLQHYPYEDVTGYKDLFKVTTDNFFDYQRVRVLNSSNKIKDNFIQESHLKILDAIKNKRKDRVHELLNEHFSRLSAKLGYFIEEYPFYFK